MNDTDLKRAIAHYRHRFPSSTALEIESLITAGLSDAEIEHELQKRRRKYGFTDPPRP